MVSLLSRSSHASRAEQESTTRELLQHAREILGEADTEVIQAAAVTIFQIFIDSPDGVTHQVSDIVLTYLSIYLYDSQNNIPYIIPS